MPLLPHPRDIVVIYKATNEFEAIAIRDFLAAEGVPAMIRSRVIHPVHELLGILGPEAGVYADILVLPQHEGEARRMIAEYLDALKREPVEESPP